MENAQSQRGRLIIGVLRVTLCCCFEVTYLVLVLTVVVDNIVNIT